MQMTASVFELSHGSVALDGHIVLHDVDFAMDAGAFVVLLGANGSGKTTLVRALLGLTPLQSGRVKLFGQPLDRFGQWERIGYVPQRHGAAAGVPATVGEVVLSGRIARVKPFRRFVAADREAAERALQTVGLDDLIDTPVTSLSGGQQQRVLIARALATEPDVLVLDEPVSAVDIEHQESFAVTLETLKDTGHSVLLVAHALGAMEPLVDRAVVLEGGHVGYDGPPSRGQVPEAHVHHHPPAREGGPR